MEQIWVMGKCGSEFRCGVTRSVTLAVKWTFMSRAFLRVWKKDDTNSIPQSEATCDETLCLEKTEYG